MENKSLRVRVCKSTGEVEIEGQPELVRQWWDELSGLVLGEQRNEPNRQAPRALPVVSGGAHANSLPETFGEYLHQFPTEISDNDRMLIAASFVEGSSGDRSFTTGAANQVLMDQGIRLANPSVCIGRLTAARRVFRLTGNSHRVSAEGRNHLATLIAGEE